MKKTLLGSIADIQTGPFGSQLHKEDYVEKGTPIVTVEHLGNRVFTEQNLPMVSDYDKERLNKYVLCEGDIVFSRVGSVDRCSYVDSNHSGWMFSGRCLRVRPSDKLYPLYLYYYFCMESTKRFVRNIAVGATMPSINTKLMGEVEISVPSIDTQKRIVTILSSIDDKIELNAVINENLEQQAQALYRQVFVNADDNQSATIADISLNVTDGVHNTVKDDPEGNYLLLSCKNIKGGSLSIGSSERHINKETFDKLRKRTQLAKGDILISSVGTIGETLMLNTEPKNYEFQRSVAMIKPDTKIVSSAYVYESLLYKKAELINAAHGAVQQCLFISDICEFPIDIPSKVKLDMFNSAVIPMFDIITAKHEENQRLAALRDTLLPKLMSGELDVSQVQI